MNELASADYVVITSFFVVMLSIGFYFRNRMKSMFDFFGGGFSGVDVDHELVVAFIKMRDGGSAAHCGGQHNQSHRSNPHHDHECVTGGSAMSECKSHVHCPSGT